MPRIRSLHGSLKRGTVLRQPKTVRSSIMLSSVLAEHFTDVVCLVVEAVYPRSAKQQEESYLMEVYIRRDTFPLNPDNLTPYPNSSSKQPTFIQIILPLPLDSSKLSLSNQPPIIVTMKFIAATLAAFLVAAGTAAAAPTEAALEVVEIFPRTADRDIEKRGYGCKVIGDDDVGVCNFHVRHHVYLPLPKLPALLKRPVTEADSFPQCINDVIKNCGGGKVIRPYKGVCGGFASA